VRFDLTELCLLSDLFFPCKWTLKVTDIEKGFADKHVIDGSVTFQHFFEDFVPLFP
jgi:hypothetical protein